MTLCKIPYYLKVPLLCLSWYSVASLSNVIGKTILSQFPYPLTLTFVHILVTAVLSFPLVQFAQLRSCVDCIPKNYFMTFVLPISFCKVLTMASGHVAIWRIPVSYAHTVKASTPIFTVILSRILFNERQNLPVYLSLIPIIAGVAIATVTELSFEYIGLLAGLGFTLGISLQNIFNKRLMKLTGIHSFELLAILSRVSILLVTPLWIFFDLKILVENRHTINMNTDWWTVSSLLGVDGLLNFVQNIIAFAFLSLVAPLTFSVANASKRIAIIGVSLIVLRNPVTVLNVIGMAIAVGGVLLYSYFRHRQNKLKKKLDKTKEPKMEKGNNYSLEFETKNLLPILHGHGSSNTKLNSISVPDIVSSSKLPVIEEPQLSQSNGVSVSVINIL